MSNATSASKAAKWIQVAVVIGFAISFFKSCSDQSEERDIEMRGLGMLEAKGFHLVPREAGSVYYDMRYDGTNTAEEFRLFFSSLRVWEAGYWELSKRGLSDSEIMAIPEYEIRAAMRHANSEAELNKLTLIHDKLLE